MQSGLLPVRVLELNFLDWFQNLPSPEFQEDLKQALLEYDEHPFQKGFAYHVGPRVNFEIAYIDQGQIQLFENYNQLLWCLSYALLVLFEEGYKKPLLSGTFTGRIDLEHPEVKKALKTFKFGMTLFKSYNKELFYHIPNPEKVAESDKDYVDKANGVFTAGMTFTLLHEFAHDFYGHEKVKSSDEDSKQFEFDADAYALQSISSTFPIETGQTFKLGVIASLCSFIFIDKQMQGSREHPEEDKRIDFGIEKLALSDEDDIWGIASLGYWLWSFHFKVDFTLSKECETFKDLYLEFKSNVGVYKNYL